MSLISLWNSCLWPFTVEVNELNGLFQRIWFYDSEWGFLFQETMWNENVLQYSSNSICLSSMYLLQSGSGRYQRKKILVFGNNKDINSKKTEKYFPIHKWMTLFTQLFIFLWQMAQLQEPINKFLNSINEPLVWGVSSTCLVLHMLSWHERWFL